MAAITFEINNIPLSVSPNSVVTLEKEFANVQDIGSYTSTRSYTFRVQNIGNAFEVFGHYANVNAEGNIDPRQKLPATLKVGVTTTLYGHAQLTGVYHAPDKTFQEYEVVFYGEAMTLSRDIADTKLADLDYTDLAHVLDSTNFEDLITQAYANGDIVYTMVEKGQKWANDNTPGTRFITAGDITNRNYYADFTPAIRERWLVRKIIESRGYSLYSDFLDSSEFDDKYTLFLNGRWTIMDTKAENQFGGMFAVDDDVVLAPSAGNIATNTNVLTVSQSDGDLTVAFDLGSNFDPVAVPDFTAPYAGFFTFSVHIPLQTNYTTGFFFFLTIGGINAAQGAVAPYNPSALNTWEYFDADWTVFLEAGDAVALKYIVTNNGTFGVDNITIGGNATQNSDAASIFMLNCSPPLYDDAVDINGNAPDMKQIDYLKAVMGKYNMAIIPDPNHPKGVIIEPLVDMLYSGADLDWTNKLEAGKDITDRPTTDIQSRNVYLEYTKGTDMISKVVADVTKVNYGTQLLDNPNNEFAIGDKRITNAFFPIPCNTVAGTDIILHKAVDDKGQGIYGQPKGGYFKSEPSVTPCRVFNPTLVAMENFSSYPYIGHYQQPEVDFGDYDDNFGTVQPWHTYEAIPSSTLFQRFWRPYLDEIYSPLARMRKAKVYLTPLEFFSLDFRDRIWIKDSWWRVNKVSGFQTTTQATCEVELIKQVFEPRACDFVYSSQTDGGLMIFTDLAGDPSFGNQTCCEFYGGQWVGNGFDKCFKIPGRPDVVSGDSVESTSKSTTKKAQGNSVVLSDDNTFINQPYKSIIAGEGHTIGQGMSGGGNMVYGIAASVNLPGMVRGVCPGMQQGGVDFCANADFSGGVGSVALIVDGTTADITLDSGQGMYGMVTLLVVDANVILSATFAIKVFNDAGTIGFATNLVDNQYDTGNPPDLAIANMTSTSFQLEFTANAAIGFGDMKYMAHWAYILGSY